MSDGSRVDAAGHVGSSAGALLKQARLAQGLEVDTLASLIKVSPRKLELLEADRFDELHDATFVRALAQSVCRTLRIDVAPVLTLLPQSQQMRLDQINQGLNTPFRDRPSGLMPIDWTFLAKPIVWAPALIAIAAIALYFYPSELIGPSKTALKVAPAASPAASAVVNATPASAPPTPVVETVYSTPPQPESPGGSAPVVATVNGLVQLRTSAQSWVEVVDARGQMLLSRVIQPGETIGLDGPLPLRVKIGNAAGTQLMFRGEPVELSVYTRENIAKLELK
jgi:cytoskeleton protein RodZ